MLGTLVNIASTTYDVFTLATSEDDLSARELGTNILLTLLPAKHVLRILNRGCKANSFIGGTLVKTDQGLIPIEDIEIGMKVLAFNEETNKTDYQEVTHVISGEGYKELINIKLDTGEIITSTSGHPFYVEGEWRDAVDLTSTNNLLDSDGDFVNIFSLKSISKTVKVHNISVANDHNYYVGVDEILNHNANCFKLKSRLKENPVLAKEARNAGKSQKVQKDLNDLTKKLSEGNLNPGIGTKPIGKGISEARSREGARVYFRVIQGEIQILGKSSKANQAKVIKEILKTF